LICDRTKFPQGSFEFVHRLNEVSPVLLTGVFMAEAKYHSFWAYASAGAGETIYELAPDPVEEEAIRQTILLFGKLCAKNDISYRVHNNVDDYAIPQFKKESRFADLAIFSSEVFYGGLEKDDQYDFIRDA